MASAASRFLIVGLLVVPCLAADVPREKQVTFSGVGGATLTGTLMLPAGNKAGPAVVLLAGSGPTDRNGNQPPFLVTDLLKQIAEGLAEKGVASFARQAGHVCQQSPDAPRGGQAWRLLHLGELCRRRRCRLQVPTAQPRVDPDHVGIVGHSEGGTLALEAAGVLIREGHAPAALILLSTPGRPTAQILTEQLKSLLAKQRATPKQTDYFISENTRITAAILKDGHVPKDVPPGLAALYPQYLGKFLHSELALDPCKLAAAYPGPVLIVAGSADTQVSADRDAKALDAALATRKDDLHSLAIIPNASHNLKIPTDADDPGFRGPVAPAAMDQLREWVAAHLKSD